MSGDTFQLKVFTPEGLALDDSTGSVSLPAKDGEVGILPQHVSYTGILGTGILEYAPAGSGSKKRVVVSGGFCNFSGDSLTLLADSIDFPENIDRSNYGKDRAALESVIKEGNAGSPEFQAASDKLARIDAIDRLLGIH